MGAPTGLLIVRELYAPRAIATELSSERLTYLYVLISTAVVLAFLGFVLGRQADRLAALSETDVLTGLANRRALRRRLEVEFRRSKRYRTPVSLLLVDIDGLKQLNDTHGHEAGDRMIRTVAHAIARGLRESDLGVGGVEMSSRSSHPARQRMPLIHPPSGWSHVWTISMTRILAAAPPSRSGSPPTTQQRAAATLRSDWIARLTAIALEVEQIADARTALTGVHVPFNINLYVGKTARLECSRPVLGGEL
jgi:hypothetical protein